MDYTQMDLKWINMMAGIEAQVPFIRDSPREVYRQGRDQLSLRQAPSRVYLVGCGDSWYCGMATRLAFEAWAGVPTEAQQALEFSRYYCEYAPTDALVVAISNSGRVSRTVETVMRARARAQDRRRHERARQSCRQESGRRARSRLRGASFCAGDVFSHRLSAAAILRRATSCRGRRAAECRPGRSQAG